MIGRYSMRLSSGKMKDYQHHHFTTYSPTLGVGNPHSANLGSHVQYVAAWGGKGGLNE